VAKKERRKSRRQRAESESLDREYLSAMSGAGAATESSSEAPAEIVIEGAGAGPVRRTFGEGDLAWMVVEISPDSMAASLQELCFAGDSSLEPERVRQALRQLYHIAAGLNAELIDQLSTRAAASPGRVVRGDFPIARGLPPSAGDDGGIGFPFLDEGDSPPAGAELRTSLEQAELAAALAPDLSAQLVCPATEIALVVPPSGGRQGEDVFGNPVPVGDATSRLRPGSGVQLVEDRYTAAIYGYVCLDADEISVLSPIWISADRTEAHFIHYPQPGDDPTPDSGWLMHLLELKGVTSGIEEPAIEKLCRGALDAREKVSVRVAAGTPPSPGIDAHVSYAIDVEKRSGAIQEDGSIDLRERNMAVGIGADQLLGEFVPATTGQPGLDLMGQQIPAADGVVKEITAGENVRTETEGDVVRFFSEIDGAVTIKGDTVQVNPVLALNGDVNYDTGNIDVPGDVQISGSVSTGFTVKAGGNVTVGDTIESGAEVRARGDIAAGKGIVGENTKVVAIGSVETKFIQNATVMAQGDIRVGAYIHNAAVRAGGKVIVSSGGGGRGGSIVGGEVIATRGIEAKLVGSATTDCTEVGIGPDPETAARLARARKAIEFADTGIRRILRTLGVETVDAQVLTDLIERAPRARKELVIGLVKRLREAVDTKEESLRAERELQEQISQALAEAQIRVTDRVFAGTLVRFGDDLSAIADDLGSAVFFRTEDGVRYRPELTE